MYPRRRGKGRQPRGPPRTYALARALLVQRVMRMLAVVGLLGVMAVTSGCYLGVKGGPSYHSRGGRAIENVGAEFEVTAGIEMYFDSPAVLNPLAGKTRLATGGGGFSTEADGRPTTPPAGVARTAYAIPAGSAVDPGQRASGGLWTLELGRTLWQDNWSGSRGEPTSGALLRAVASFGTGGGVLTRTDTVGDALTSESMTAISYAVGVEGAIHGGGSTIDSYGLALGTGVKVSHFTADGYAAEAITPYVSLTIEGGFLLQAWAAVMKSGFRCR